VKKLREAVELYERFHWGKLPESVQEVQIEVPEVFVNLGKLLGVIYLSNKDGKVRPYVHFFGRGEPFELRCHRGQVVLAAKRQVSYSELPDLLTDHKGKGLFIYGGNFRVRKEGIVG
jgi:hypothetical protein